MTRLRNIWLQRSAIRGAMLLLALVSWAALPSAAAAQVPNAPALALHTTRGHVRAGGRSSLVWHARGARFCRASGGWRGRRGPRGNVPVGPLQATSTFTLTCLKGRRYARSRVTIFVGASAPYWDEPLDGGFANPFFGNVLPQNGVSPFSFVAGASGRAGRLTDCAVSSPGRCVDGTMFQSSSSYGQIATMRVLCQYDHAGWTPGTGSTCERADGHEQDTWYRFKVRFPSVAYAATPGAQNAVFEFHVDTKTEADAQAHGQAAYSTMIGVQTDGPIASYCTGNPLYCTSPGHNPRLYMQVAGGPLSNGAGDVRRFYPFAPGSLRFDHWYDMVLHIVWSPSPARGLVQWWADSVQAVNTVGPTEYTRYDGSFSYAQSMAMVNYRYWANFPSSIDFDEITIGPSSSSVAAIGFPGWAPAAVHQGA